MVSFNSHPSLKNRLPNFFFFILQAEDWSLDQLGGLPWVKIWEITKLGLELLALASQLLFSHFWGVIIADSTISVTENSH